MTPTRQTRSASRARARRITSKSQGAKRSVDVRKRLLVLLGAFLLVGIGFVGVLIDLQAVRPDMYVAIGENQRTRTVHLPGYRGTITDRDGFVLALSTPGVEIVADPLMIENPAATAALLAPILDLSVDELTETLRPANDGDRYAMVAADLNDERTARIALLKEDEDNNKALVGIFVRAQENRVYPADSLALPVVGRVDPQEIGYSGLEWQFDEIMQGSGGYERSEAGAFGSITGGEYVFEPAIPGNDIVLTLDHRIQYVTEQALIAHCDETQAEGANAVVSDPRTGELLAMATVIRGEHGCFVPRQNAPLVATFEPGSVIKMVTAAAAVEDHGITADTIIEVPAEITVGDKQFFNHSPAAPYPVRQVIADSMNTGTIGLAQMVGPERLRHYLGGFGFGKTTGLDFRYEARGNVPEEWFGSDLGSIAIGQGVSVNTVQLAAAYNVIANDGLYISPSLIRTMVGPDGEQILGQAQPSHRVVSSETAEEVTTMLTDVVAGGTGVSAAVPGYTVAGKTGTAWQAFEQANGSYGYGESGNRKYVVTFAGFLPAESPELSIVVVVNEPKTATTASKIAAPVFADIAQYAIRILAIPPSDRSLVDPSGQDLVRGTPAPQPGEQVVALGQPADQVAQSDEPVPETD